MNKIISLLYHEVLRGSMKSGFQNNDNLSYMHDEIEFEKHVLLVKKRIDYNFENSNNEEILFTFDDGGVSNLVAAEILERHGLRGVFFITTCKINQPHFLNESQILALRNAGHVVGSHSHTHPMIFRSLSPSQMLEEWQRSKDILEKILREEIIYCSVPGGDANTATYETARKVGYFYVFDSEPIVYIRKCKNIQIFGRLSIKSKTSIREIEATIALENLKKLQMMRKVKAFVKKVIFPLHQYIQNKKNGK